MDTLMVILTLSSMFAEYKIATGTGFVGRFVARNPIVSFVFSVIFSLMLGMFFGAAGLIAMTAGILSSMFMVPVYWALREGHIAKIHAAGHMTKAKLSANQEAFVAFGKASWAIALLVWAVVCFLIGVLVFLVKCLGWVANRWNWTTGKDVVTP